MDVETSEAIEGLSNRVDALGFDLRGEIATQGVSLRAEIAQQGAELRAGMAAQTAQLRAEMAAQGAELRSEMTGIRVDVRGEIQRLAERVEDNRRHADIQFESIRDDIRIVAEGVATLAVKLDRK
jgi:hypothetical protein